MSAARLLLTKSSPLPVDVAGRVTRVRTRVHFSLSYELHRWFVALGFFVFPRAGGAGLLGRGPVASIVLQQATPVLHGARDVSLWEGSAETARLFRLPGTVRYGGNPTYPGAQSAACAD